MSEVASERRVPMAPLLRIIEQAIERSHYLEREGRYSDEVLMEGGIQIVSEHLGYSHRRIYHLREQATCTFEVADKIVCRLAPGGFLAWLTDPELAPIYEAITSQPLTPNRQDLEIEGDEAALAELERRRQYSQQHNTLRSARRAARRAAEKGTGLGSSRAAKRAAAEALDVLEEAVA